MRMGPQEVVWIAGAAGRMGRAIEHRLDHEKYRILTTDAEVDATDLDTVVHFAAANRPDYVINCAGLARHDTAQERPDDAYKINALGARNLAIASESVGAKIIHLSTDDLFPANMPHAVNEFDPALPRHVFGKSKLAGEKLVRDMNPRHIIIRSSWVYTALPDDMIVSAITKARASEPVEVPANQFACPTSCKTVAEFIIAIMESEEFGTFHVTSEGLCSRFEFIARALKLAGAPMDTLVSRQNPDEAYRVDLDNLMIRLTGIYELRTWEEDLKDYMAEHDLLA